MHTNVIENVFVFCYCFPTFTRCCDFSTRIIIFYFAIIFKEGKGKRGRRLIQVVMNGTRFFMNEKLLRFDEMFKTSGNKRFSRFLHFFDNHGWNERYLWKKFPVAFRRKFHVNATEKHNGNNEMLNQHQFHGFKCSSK